MAQLTFGGARWRQNGRLAQGGHAARQAAAQGQLTGAPDYLQNALARCSLQPPMERSACEARVRGTGQTEIEGSVLGGGVIRETVTPIR